MQSNDNESPVTWGSPIAGTSVDSEAAVIEPKARKVALPLQIGDLFESRGVVYVVRKKSFKGDIVCRRVA